MKFIVNGGKPLSGSIDVRGSKNAATPILAATILTGRTCLISNIPLIGDVFVMIDIIKSMGGEVEWIGERTLKISNENIDPKKLDKKLVRKIRSSILIVGPLLARFGEAELSTPGGCHIGVRPMDTHFDAFRDLGFEVSYDEDNDAYRIKNGKKGVKKVVLKEFSVTATENLLLFGAVHPLEVSIAAAEPHVEDLGKFLISLGAEIEGLGTHNVRVKSPIQNGGEVKYEVMNDPIEAGTFIALGVATKSDIRVTGVPSAALDIPFLKFREFGVEYEIEGDGVNVKGSASDLRGVKKIMTQPYPGFPSDLQAPFAVLATQARGETRIFDTLYEGRLKYLYELDKMGADVDIVNAHQATIRGPRHLRGKNVESIDLRAGATLVIAALVAEGESVLHTAEQIDRGYEKIEERLINLGADIKRAD